MSIGRRNMAWWSRRRLMRREIPYSTSYKISLNKLDWSTKVKMETVERTTFQTMSKKLAS